MPSINLRTLTAKTTSTMLKKSDIEKVTVGVESNWNSFEIRSIQFENL